MQRFLDSNWAASIRPGLYQPERTRHRWDIKPALGSGACSRWHVDSRCVMPRMEVPVYVSRYHACNATHHVFRSLGMSAYIISDVVESVIFRIMILLRLPYQDRMSKLLRNSSVFSS